MLGKLIKHEMKATARTFLPVYGATLAVALVTRIMMSFERHTSNSTIVNMLLALSVFLFTVLIFASGILTLVIMISRFHKNLLGEQGYLMLTLPVKPWKHIVSKLIVSNIWMFISVAISIISSMILMSYQGILRDVSRVFAEVWNIIINHFNFNAAVAGFEFIVLMIIAIAFASLMIYFAIALGHRSSKNRVAAGFGWYILISIALQILSTLFLQVFPFDAIFMGASSDTILHGSLWLTIALTAIPTAFFFWGTNKILTTKLNLE